MDAKEKGTRPVRDRQRPLRVFVTDTDREEIGRRAAQTGLSVSSYLRAAGLSLPVRSILDHEAVLSLSKVNADQGRLGGLLKLWLVEKPGQGADQGEVRQILDGIEALQRELSRAVRRL